MNNLKNYKSELILKSNTSQSFQYYNKKYLLKCNDLNNKTTHIQFKLCYEHCNYVLYVNSQIVKNVEGGFCYTFGTERPLKLTMYKTTYRFSKKQFEELENFMFLNLHNLINQFELINKNIIVE